MPRVEILRLRVRPRVADEPFAQDDKNRKTRGLLEGFETPQNKKAGTHESVPALVLAGCPDKLVCIHRG
jgi:hypothetical protein